jgi:hypothetical protein
MDGAASSAPESGFSHVVICRETRNQNQRLETRDPKPKTSHLLFVGQFGGLRMRVALLIPLVLCSVVARADYIVKQTIENAGQSQEVTLKLKDTKLRIDTTPQTSAIIDSKTGETTVLVHPQKMYMKVGSEQIKAQAEAMKGVIGGDQKTPPELKASGKKETINGFQTEEYTTQTAGMPTTVFIDKTFPNYQKLVAAIYNAQSGPGMEIFRSTSVAPEKYPGMPIRTIIEVQGQKMVTTLTSAQETPVPDSDFAVPADYKELNPQMLEDSRKQPVPPAQQTPQSQ